MGKNCGKGTKRAVNLFCLLTIHRLQLREFVHIVTAEASLLFEMRAVNHKSPVANSVRKGQEDAVVRQHSRQLGGERTSLSNDIDPPVNILLKPKQETTDLMLAETYKLLILRIMTTKVKSMENIYPPVHVKGYQPTEAFKEEIRVV